MVTPQMLRIGIAGTVDVLLKRLDGLASLGVRSYQLRSALGSRHKGGDQCDWTAMSFLVFERYEEPCISHFAGLIQVD